MNGAESLVRTLVAGGVDVCFTNPGTSEMHFVAALDRVEGMRCVLGLFEGVVTGAADGYFRMKGKPASTLLHLGPGLANGLANLHNAKKANSGIVNIVGQHAVYHIGYNAPLTSDIEGLARPMSAWVKTSPDAKSVADVDHRFRQSLGRKVFAEHSPGQFHIRQFLLPEFVMHKLVAVNSFVNATVHAQVGLPVPVQVHFAESNAPRYRRFKDSGGHRLAMPHHLARHAYVYRNQLHTSRLQANVCQRKT